MRIGGERRSDNYQDAGRGYSSGPSGSRMGGLNPYILFILLRRLIFRRDGRISWIRVILILLVVGFFYFRGSMSSYLPQSGDNRPVQTAISQEAPGKAGQSGQGNDSFGGSNARATDAEIKDYLLVVLAQTEDLYTKLFAAQGLRYEPTTLVFFEGAVQSACGYAEAAVGPFYCPGDSKVYVDLSFFRELATRYRADGDFVMGYVLAHEVGHHVQNLLGISYENHKARERASKAEANRLSVRLELQADYFAGVWAHYVDSKGILDDGDIEEAINAASAIGDDRLQKRARGYVVPDSFTHGTSEQRVRWFKRGYKYGTLTDGNTYNIPYNELRQTLPLSLRAA